MGWHVTSHPIKWLFLEVQCYILKFMNLNFTKTFEMVKKIKIHAGRGIKVFLSGKIEKWDGRNG